MNIVEEARLGSCSSCYPSADLFLRLTALMCKCASAQAELFRLEGLFHRALGDAEAANCAFSTSLALWPQLAAGWLSWGDFCDNRVHPLVFNFQLKTL